MKCSGDTGLGIESFQDINVGVDVEEVDEDDESYDTVDEEELLEQFLLSGIRLNTKGATTEIRLPSQTIVSGKFRTAEYNRILDRGSIRSSPRDGLSSPHRLTKGLVWDCSTMPLSSWETYSWSILH